MKLEKRASFGWPAHPDVPRAPCKNGMVAHYDGGNQGLAGKNHTACRTYWKNTRKFHMNTRGWNDVGYAFMVCPHGIVFEGRGFGYAQAAQPGGNTTWTSCTFATGPDEFPTQLQLDAWRELRAWLRGKGVAAAIRPHGSFVSTSCPGSKIRTLITNGQLAASHVPQKPTPPKETGMALALVVDLGMKKPHTVPAGKRGSIPFEIEYKDDSKVHTDAKGDSRYPSIFVKGGDRPYVLTAELRLASRAKVGARVTLASYERDTNKFERDIRGSDADGKNINFPLVIRMSELHKYRLDFINGTDTDVVIDEAYLTISH
jgi:hypothetical protein